jgi:hypothetical protein
MNGAVSKVGKEVISRPTRTQHALSAAEQSRFLVLHLQFASNEYKMAPQQQKAFCALRFDVSRSVITVQPDFRARFKKDAPHRNVSFNPLTKHTAL